MSRKFFITDVFSEGPYAGNQLATMPDASGISAEEMQQIARAFNFAETTFITGGSLEKGFDVRIFSPNSELPFAGHPTLGSRCRDHHPSRRTPCAWYQLPDTKRDLKIGCTRTDIEPGGWTDLRYIRRRRCTMDDAKPA